MFYCSLFFHHGISEVCQLIGAKFCTMVCTELIFENWVQKF